MVATLSADGGWGGMLKWLGSTWTAPHRQALDNWVPELN